MDKQRSGPRKRPRSEGESYGRNASISRYRPYSNGVYVERYAYDLNGDTIWQDSEGIGHWEPKDLEERCWAGSEDPGCRSHYGNVRPQ